MLEAMYKLFIPFDKIKERCETDFEYISEVAKSKLVIILVNILSFTAVPIFIYRGFILQQLSANLFAFFLTPIIFYSSLYYFKKSGNYKPTIWLVFLVNISILPIRAYYTGGLDSPSISFFISGAVIIGFLHKKRHAYLYFIISLCQLLTLHYIKIPPTETTEALRFFTHFAAYLMVIVTIRSLITLNKTVIKENKKVEKANTIKLMVASLSHEINNPLSIGIGYLEQLDQKDENNALNKVKTSLLRIKGTLQKISEIDDVDKIEEKEYTKDINIINLNNDYTQKTK